MRIAVCFSGLAYGKGCAWKARDVECLVSLDTIRKFVYQDYQCDTYFHAWIDNEETEKKLCALLKPKAYRAEEQIVFHEDAQFNDPKLYNITSSPSKANKTRNHDALSQIFSRTESIKLALQAAEEEKYDFIIVLRFDLHFKAPINFKSLSKEFLYEGGYRSKKDVHHDFFFIGSPAVMQSLVPMYQFVQEGVDSGKRIIRDIHRHVYGQFFADTSHETPSTKVILQYKKNFDYVRELPHRLKVKMRAKLQREVDSALQTGDVNQYLSRNTSRVNTSRVNTTTWEQLLVDHDYHTL